MLRRIVQSSSKMICTRRTSATSLYRCGSLRSFAGVGENENESKLKDAVLSANTAIFDAERRIIDHKKLVRDIGLRMTSLDKAIESKDIPQIKAAIKDLEQNFILSSFRKRNSFPTQSTVLLLQRFGGKPSVWMGRNLMVLQYKMLKKVLGMAKMEVELMKVEAVWSRRLTDDLANIILARSIVATIVLSLFFYF